ncbi:NusG domain II-containing protein [Desulfitobacterium metallireducens]|uniref:Uncharacterized protein n=1 Tax=Desulfitobacterium metallireducens DSM 15288 TaxID=871968 RepID=W0EB98_9FIRM|nr:NusG domain II-containing protein [Desulfitobacterium metallireducens]AHF06489.1 hypothetical protein DESME_05005 [Desulfitobacterium metallireducens DSM 15288]
MKKLEKIIVAVILLLSILSMGIMMISKPNNQDGIIVIQVDNKVVKKVALNYSSEVKTYEFSFNGNIASIESKNGSVRLLEMSDELCPNHICSDTGWINQSYQSIVCLPNQIIITIEGGEADKENKGQIDIVI